MKHKKYWLIAIIAVLLIGVGVTFAYYITGVLKNGQGSSANLQTATVEDTTLAIEGNIDLGSEITTSNMYPGHKVVVELKLTATGTMTPIYNLVWRGTNTLKTTFKYEVYKSSEKQTPSISCSKATNSADGYVYYYENCTNSNFNNLGNPVSKGVIRSTSEEKTIRLTRNETIAATEAGKTVYYYIVLEYPNTDSNQNIDGGGSLNGITTIEILPEEMLASLSDYLLTTGELIEEDGFRYEGANPNNYVNFNNELWRIIGILDTKNADTNETESLVKLIRNESIGNIMWDSTNWNNWAEADVMLLFSQYYNNANINYTYRKNGGETITIEGINLNDTAKNMIQNATWNLGGSVNSNRTVSEFYKEERGSVGAYNNSSLTEWNGLVGLINPSDYGYAADSVHCPRTTTLNTYGNESCKTNNWLYTGSNMWTLNSRSNFYSLFSIMASGEISDKYSTEQYAVKPTVYLKANVKVLDNGKDGSQTHPYDLVLS